MLKKLNLGSGNKYLEGYLNVELNPELKADIYCDIFELSSIYDMALQLLGTGFDEVRCENVINYCPSKPELHMFFENLYEIMADKSVLHLEFMNIANSEGLRLHYFIIRQYLKDAGFEPTLLTKRHLIIPTGNVKVRCVKNV